MTKNKKTKRDEHDRKDEEKGQIEAGKDTGRKAKEQRQTETEAATRVMMDGAKNKSKQDGQVRQEGRSRKTDWARSR